MNKGGSRVDAKVEVNVHSGLLSALSYDQGRYASRFLQKLTCTSPGFA